MSDLIHTDAGAEIGPGVRALLDKVANYLELPGLSDAEMIRRQLYAADVMLRAALHPDLTTELAALVNNLIVAASAPPARPADTTQFAIVPADEPGPEPLADDSDRTE
jgi:hypothetical protein